MMEMAGRWFFIALLIGSPLTAYAVPEISRASRPVLRLEAGGRTQTVLLEGRRLGEINSVVLADNNSGNSNGIGPAVKVELGKSLASGSMRLLYFNAADNALPGQYQIQLLTADGMSEVSAELIQVDLRQPRAGLGGQRAVPPTKAAVADKKPSEAEVSVSPVVVKPEAKPQPKAPVTSGEARAVEIVASDVEPPAEQRSATTKPAVVVPADKGRVVQRPLVLGPVIESVSGAPRLLLLPPGVGRDAAAASATQDSASENRASEANSASEANNASETNNASEARTVANGSRTVVELPAIDEFGPPRPPEADSQTSSSPRDAVVVAGASTSNSPNSNSQPPAEPARKPSRKSAGRPSRRKLPPLDDLAPEDELQPEDSLANEEFDDGGYPDDELYPEDDFPAGLDDGAPRVAIANTGTAGLAISLPVYWIQGMADRATLVGSVRDAFTGEPIPGARLSAGSQSAVTDVAGIYGLPVASYVTPLTVQAPGYKPVLRNTPRVSGKQLAELDVALLPENPETNTQSLPDVMLVSPPSVPVCRGVEQPVRIRVLNTGRRAARDYKLALQLRHWREGGPAEGEDDEPLVIAGPVLQPGETKVVDIPAFVDSEARWAQIDVVADPDNQLREQRENNNQSNPRRLVVSSLPDCDQAEISLADLALPPKVTIALDNGVEGCELVVNAELANFSNRGTPPAEVVLQLRTDKVSAWAGQVEVPELVMNESRPVQFRVPVDKVVASLARQLATPSMLPGQAVTLVLEADPQRRAEERFTSNNRLQFDGLLSELIPADDLLYRKRAEDCQTLR